MDLELKSKTAFISGSTQGIGFATARKLLQEDAGVIINGRDQYRVAISVENLMGEFPAGRISGIAADFSKPAEISRLIEEMPIIDILINNVGIFELKDFVDITDQEWYRFFEINVMSGVRLSRAILPGMISANKGGRIIFISSESAVKIPANMIHYAMTKTAMLSISRGLAELTKDTTVTVNSILGGPTYSDGVSDVIEHIASSCGQNVETFKDELFRSMNPSSLIQRFIEPNEIANLAVYLSSPLSSATNGASLKADGGLLQSVL